MTTATITGQLMELQYGDAQEFENLVVVPLFAPHIKSPHYQTMEEAMQAGKLLVTEVGDGTVPELKVTNKASVPVLIIDGEELVGAKQNRVLNTTVLLKENQKTVIPVSCTEQGRWSFVSKRFDNSGVVMAARTRSVHKASVNLSLRSTGRFSSNQAEVWHSIGAMAREANVDTPTMAMRDVFERRSADMEKYLKAVPVMPGQQGAAAFIDGELVGCDLISLPSAYERLHPKLMRSYAVEAAISKKRISGQKRDWAQEVRELIESVQNADEQHHPSVGYGTDFRYESPTMVGSALVHEDCVIHAAFFRRQPDNDTGSIMTDPMRRLRFRMG